MAAAGACLFARAEALHEPAHHVDLDQPGSVERALRPNEDDLGGNTDNPLLKLTDLEAVAPGESTRRSRRMRQHFLPRPTQRPLEFGFDLVLHSVTKYINGIRMRSVAWWWQATTRS